MVDSSCARSSVRAAGSPSSWHSPRHLSPGQSTLCWALGTTSNSHQECRNSWESPEIRAFEVRGQTTLLTLLHTSLFSLPDTVPKAYSCYR